MFYKTIFLFISLCITQLNANEKKSNDLSKNTGIHARSSVGSTALHYAAIGDSRENIISLLELKADINARTNNDCTPLHYAASLGNMEVVRCLVENKADINAKTTRGQTPLDYALSNNGTNNSIKRFLNENPGDNINVISYLVEHKCDINSIIKEEEKYQDIAINLVKNLNICSLLVGADLIEPIKTMFLLFNRQKKDLHPFCPPKPIQKKIISYYCVNSSITTFIQNLHKKNLLDGDEFTLVRNLFCLI